MLIYQKTHNHFRGKGESDDKPTRTYGRKGKPYDRYCRTQLRPVLLRALNKNQILILSSVNGFEYVTPLLSGLSNRYKVPLSTLKLNARILRELNIIEFGNSAVRLTKFGKLIFDVIKT